MPNKLVKKEMDIYQHPQEIDLNNGSITIGDLHGNAVKLLHFLLTNQVVAFKDPDQKKALYQEFVDLYEKSDMVARCYLDMKPIQNRIDFHQSGLQAMLERQEELSNKDQKSQAEIDELNNLNAPINNKISNNISYKQQLLDGQQEELQKKLDEIATIGFDLKDLPSKLNNILQELKVVNKGTLVRLIGDELADRGSNDFLTLKLLGFLHDNQVKVNILISNHSNEFIRSYEALNFERPSGAIEGKDQRSFGNMKLLLDEGIISREEVTKLVNDAYKPRLKVLDYTLSKKGITLFTHAPVCFDRIKTVAEHLGVVYNDSTKEALAATIDKINTLFADIVQENRIHKFCAATSVKAGFMTSEEIARLPLVDIIWNRWSDEKDTPKARPANIHHYGVYYVHGHDPFQSKFEHVINLDTSCGKMLRIDEENYVKKAIEIINMAHSCEDAKKFIAGINEYKILTSDERGLQQKHDAGLIKQEFIQSKWMSQGKRNALITGLLGAAGLVLGIGIGVALVATGVFAPVGLSVIASMAIAAASTGAGAAVIGVATGYGVAKISEPTRIKTTVIGLEITTNPGLSNLANSRKSIKSEGSSAHKASNEQKDSKKKPINKSAQSINLDNDSRDSLNP